MEFMLQNWYHTSFFFYVDVSMDANFTTVRVKQSTYKMKHYNDAGKDLICFIVNNFDKNEIRNQGWSF